MATGGQQRYRKQDRVRRPAEYRHIMRRGRRRRGKRFDVVVARGRAQHGTRLGIAVPKAVGGSVVRSRLKRLVREYFRTHRSGFPTGMDVVVIARAAPGRLTRKHVEEIGRLLEATGWRDARSRSEQQPS